MYAYNYYLLCTAKEFFKESMKGGGKGSVTQLVGNTATGATMECVKEVSKKIMGQGMKSVATQATTATVKEAVKQTAKVAAPIGLAIETVCWGYEIDCAHKKKKRGEITKEQFRDICVEQTAISGGSAAGGIGGSLGGTAAGFLIGTGILPVVGTVIGGTIGAFAGGILGGLGGSVLGKGVGKVINITRHKILPF